MNTDVFAERFAAVRERFVAKLDGRIDEIEATVPQLGSDGAFDVLERAHRRAHDLCGVGPTMGFVATGKAARAIEQLLLAALKEKRALAADEVETVRQGLVTLRAAAKAESQPTGPGLVP